MQNAKEDRAQLRSKILSTRRALPEDYIIQSSKTVLGSLLYHPFLRQKRRICSYMNVRGEINTHEINDFLLKAGHTLARPVMGDRRGHMKFYTVTDLLRLTPNKFSILEPQPDEQTLLIPDNVDMILVPLVGFDMQGNRLGMGGGYYDRMLKKVSADCLCIGLAYDFQCVEEIPIEDWDMPLDEVITPTGHHIFNRKY